MAEPPDEESPLRPLERLARTVLATDWVREPANVLAVVGTIFGAIVGALITGYFALSAANSAERAKRYELSHVDAAKAYTALLVALDDARAGSQAFRQSQFEASKKGIPFDGAAFVAARAASVTAVRKASLSLAVCLNGPWVEWLERLAIGYASGEWGDSDLQMYRDQLTAIRSALPPVLFRQDPDAPFPPTPGPNDYVSTPVPSPTARPPVTPDPHVTPIGELMTTEQLDKQLRAEATAIAIRVRTLTPKRR
jgi:hypothetical protein